MAVEIHVLSFVFHIQLHIICIIIYFVIERLNLQMNDLFDEYIVHNSLVLRGIHVHLCYTLAAGHMQRHLMQNNNSTIKDLEAHGANKLI